MDKVLPKELLDIIYMYNLPRLNDELQKQIINTNRYFGTMVDGSSWIVYKSCYHKFCIRQNDLYHLCWPGGRYTT